MKKLNIQISADDKRCNITINGISKDYELQGSVVRGLQKDDWEDDIDSGRLEESFQVITDHLVFVPLEAIHACSNIN